MLRDLGELAGPRGDHSRPRGPQIGPVFPLPDGQDQRQDFRGEIGGFRPGLARQEPMAGPHEIPQADRCRRLGDEPGQVRRAVMPGGFEPDLLHQLGQLGIGTGRAVPGRFRRVGMDLLQDLQRGHARVRG